jgi:hypothetical protein
MRPKAVNINPFGTAVDTNFSIFYSTRSIINFLQTFNTKVQPHFIDGLGTFEVKRPRKIRKFIKFTFVTGLIELSEETRIKQFLLLPHYDLIPYKIQVIFIFDSRARTRSSECLVRMLGFPIRIF